ncbi:MAG: glycoside hydrolase family 38 C-terminal domain-containing protein [Candidatus Bathyarchaeia archaeon]
MARWHLIGHAHIDAEWLWTFKETLEVCRETFNSVLNLMREYPMFTFCQSSACYYEIMEKLYPEIFGEIKRRIEEGRWEVVGGSWVEFDANMPSGESLARQFLYGQRYFKERFGSYVEVGWLPDSFGFAWTLPQIMAKSGIKYFLTQKLSWNDMVYYPFNVFFWESPDGTRILSHQTLGSYSEEIRDENIGRFNRQASMLKHLHGIEDLLILYGVGDHGGGPRKSDLETLSKWVESSNLPAKVCSTRAIDYFRTLEQYSGKANIPVVSDELYLQYHRGVYTTQSRFKQINRRSEVLIDEVERFSLIASIVGGEYPEDELREFWKKIMLHQFHDTISGSGIREIYGDCERDFKELLEFSSKALDKALKTIASKVDTQLEGQPLLIFNPLSWGRRDVVEVELADVEKPFEVLDPAGVSIPLQLVDDGRKMLIIAEAPSLGYTVYRLKPVDAWRNYQTDVRVFRLDGKIILENSKVKLSISSKTGVIEELYDKELGLNLIGGGGVRIQVFEDYPYPGRRTLFYDFDAAIFDAWEVYIYTQPGGVKYVDLREAEEVKVLERGPVRATVLVKYRFKQDGRKDSTFNVYIRLFSGLPTIRMDFEVDWHAAHRMAKLTVPFSFHSDYTTCEIPYGYIKRRSPLSPDATLYEKAKYEAPCQKWVDYTSEDGKFGLSILNDSKYGYDQAGDAVRMSLLRSPRYPPRWGGSEEAFLREENIADQGMHRFSFALYPHKGDWRESQTVRKAYEFNYPLISRFEDRHAGNLPRSFSFLEAKPENIVVTALKKAEDCGNAIVIRFYETHGNNVDAEVSTPYKPREIYETDILEREIRKIESLSKILVSHNEIKTLKLKL